MSLGLIHRRPVHPFAALREAERAFDRLNRRGTPVRRVAGGPQSWSPRLEAVETEEGFEVTAEMPGVARDDLEISVQEGVLTVKGLRRFGGTRQTVAQETKREQEPRVEGAVQAGEASPDVSEESDSTVAANEAADENVVRFERRIRFNAEVDEESIAARYADGVLEVRVPKRMPPQPEVRTIPVEVG